MRVSWSDWGSYIELMGRVCKQAAAEMTQFMIANPAAERDAVIEYAYALATKYGEGAAALSCEMYDVLAEAQGASVPAAEPAATASYEETARAVNGTMKNKQNTVPATVERLVKLAGADTMLQNARRDGAEFAWVPRGDTCAFCLTLASRGWQRQSEKAMRNGHAEHIHANCDCEYCVRFDGKSTVEGYDPDAYLEMYQNAEGSTPQAKINAIRRAQYAQDKDRINAQKRAAYARRKERMSSKAKSVELPDSLKQAQNIPADIKQGISEAIDAIHTQYDVQISEIEYAPYFENARAPFTYIPYERDGMYHAKLNVNSLFDWNESLDSFNERIYNKNYIKGSLSSKNLGDLLKHEAAHFMTFQECRTWNDFLAREAQMRRRYVSGISMYNESMRDGAESVAEGFVRICNKERISDEAYNLVKEILGRYVR